MKINHPKPIDTYKADFKRKIADLTNIQFVKFIEDTSDWLDPISEIIKYPLVEKFIINDMIQNGYEFLKNGEEVLLTHSNEDEIDDVDTIIDYLDTENTQLKKYLSKLSWKYYISHIDIGEVRDSVEREIEERDLERDVWNAKVGSSGYYINNIIYEVIEANLQYPDDVWGESEFEQYLEHTLLNVDNIDELRVNNPVRPFKTTPWGDENTPPILCCKYGCVPFVHNERNNVYVVVITDEMSRHKDLLNFLSQYLKHEWDRMVEIPEKLVDDSDTVNELKVNNPSGTKGDFKGLDKDEVMDRIKNAPLLNLRIGKYDVDKGQKGFQIPWDHALNKKRIISTPTANRVISICNRLGITPKYVYIGWNYTEDNGQYGDYVNLKSTYVLAYYKDEPIIFAQRQTSDPRAGQFYIFSQYVKSGKAGDPITENSTKEFILNYLKIADINELKVNNPTKYKFRKNQKVQVNGFDENAGIVLEAVPNYKSIPPGAHQDMWIQDDEENLPWYLVEFISYVYPRKNEKGNIRINAFQNYRDNKEFYKEWVCENVLEPFDESRDDFKDPYVSFTDDDKDFSAELARLKSKPWWDTDDYSDLEMQELKVNNPASFNFNNNNNDLLEYINKNQNFKSRLIDLIIEDKENWLRNIDPITITNWKRNEAEIDEFLVSISDNISKILQLSVRSFAGSLSNVKLNSNNTIYYGMSVFIGPN